MLLSGIVNTDFKNKLFLGVISISIVIAIFATGYKFLWKKNYKFVVESECDPSVEQCFYRDCSNGDDCPPNSLENYKIFEVKASNFYICADSSCRVECSSNSISCHEIKCGDSENDSCALPAADNEGEQAFLNIEKIT